MKGEAIFSKRPNTRLTRADIRRLIRGARKTVRGRIRLCVHKTLDALIHEMFIVLPRGSYVRPHRHSGKTESFHVIEGAAAAVEFDRAGKVVRKIAMGPYGSGRTFFYESPAARYHSWIVTSEHFVLHEVTNGPFRREATLFAPWSPDDSDAPGIKAFLARVKKAGAPR